MANGETATTVASNKYVDHKVTDNGDGTLTVMGEYIGTIVVYNGDGRVIGRAAGILGSFEVIYDHGGTPTDPSDDVFLEFKDLGSAGKMVDLCATIVPVIGRRAVHLPRKCGITPLDRAHAASCRARRNGTKRPTVADHASLHQLLSGHSRGRRHASTSDKAGGRTSHGQTGQTLPAQPRPRRSFRPHPRASGELLLRRSQRRALRSRR